MVNVCLEEVLKTAEISFTLRLHVHDSNIQFMVNMMDDVRPCIFRRLWHNHKQSYFYSKLHNFVYILHKYPQSLWPSL